MESRFRDWYLDQTSPQWKEIHNRKDSHVYTASIISDLLGSAIGYHSPAYQYDVVKGLKTEEDISNVPPIKFGRDHEPDARDSFHAQFPFMLGSVPGLLWHHDYPNIGASLDLLAYCTKNQEIIPVEMKCMFSGILPETKDQVKEKYLVQLNIQMAVTKLKTGILWFWTADRQVGWLVQYNHDLFMECVKAVHEFEKRLQNSTRPGRTVVANTVKKALCDAVNTMKRIH